MNIKLFVILLSFTLVGHTQTTNFTYLSHKKFEHKKFDIHELGELDADGCLEDINSKTAVLIEIPTFDPESPDHKKESEMPTLDRLISELQKIVICPAIKTLILNVGEGAFLRSSDNCEIYSKNYFKNCCPLNAERFWERYGDKISLWFPNKKIVYIDWGW